MARSRRWRCFLVVSVFGPLIHWLERS
jgi:hypothetical protein